MTVNTLPTSAEVISGTQTNADQKTDFASMFDFLLSRLGSKSGQGPQTVASAATLNLDAITETRDIVISGTTPITAVTVEAGKVFRARASGAFTWTNNADILTNTGANIIMRSGDTLMIRATAVNKIELLCLSRARTRVIGSPINLSGTSVTLTSAIRPDDTDITINLIAGRVSNGDGFIIQLNGQTSGYNGACVMAANGGNTATAGAGNGFVISPTLSSLATISATVRLERTDTSTSAWSIFGSTARTDSAAAGSCKGDVTITGGAALTTVVLTSSGGSGTLSNGTVSINN